MYTVITKFLCLPLADICSLGYHNCHPNATCSVVAGGTSTSCACNTGFMGDGFNCTADPIAMICNNVVCGANAVCEVMNRVPQCVCGPGYLGDGFNCTMACGGVVCSPNAACQAVGELSQCVCNPGFMGNGVDCSRMSTTCSGVMCDRNAVCEIVSEVLQCVCKPGFVGDGSTCNRIDPCDGIRCDDPNAMCVAAGGINSQTVPMCVCNPGFTGDGRLCASLEACNATCLTIQANLHCVVLQNVIECTSPRVQQLFETVSHYFSRIFSRQNFSINFLAAN